MNHTNDIFTNMYPHLDIHGETYDTADLLIKVFINDNLKLGTKKIVIIHGKGEGILKRKTHEILKRHPKVTSFYVGLNLGSTIAELENE